ncbi:MAG: hypothetical protein V1770_03190 [bacterium]
MRVVFITEQCEVVLEAAVIFILCNKGEYEVEIQFISGKAEIVNLNDLNIPKNTAKNISVCARYFREKLVGFIKHGDWLAEQMFESITPKPDLLVILADCAEENTDDIAPLLNKAAEKLNIPIVFFNNNSGEYSVFGTEYELKEGFFWLDI